MKRFVRASIDAELRRSFALYCASAGPAQSPRLPRASPNAFVLSSSMKLGSPYHSRAASSAANQEFIEKRQKHRNRSGTMLSRPARRVPCPSGYGGQGRSVTNREHALKAPTGERAGGRRLRARRGFPQSITGSKRGRLTPFSKLNGHKTSQSLGYLSSRCDNRFPRIPSPIRSPESPSGHSQLLENSYWKPSRQCAENQNSFSPRLCVAIVSYGERSEDVMRAEGKKSSASRNERVLS